MRFNTFAKHLILILLLVCFTGRGVLVRAEEEPEPADILVIYPAAMNLKDSADNLSSLAQVITSLGYTADFADMESGRAEVWKYANLIFLNSSEVERDSYSLAEGFSGQLLILGSADHFRGIGLKAAETRAVKAEAVYTFPDQTEYHASIPVDHPGAFEEADTAAGLAEFSGGEVPLVSAVNKNRYIALTDYTTEFAKAVLSQEIAAWLWPYESRMHVYTEYVVFDEVYPFEDPYRLRRFVDLMTEQKMSYVISVMPIYQNQDYPAMQQFCEVLRFAQANGGSIVLHAPIVQNGIKPEELSEKITEAALNYFENEVYPLALEIPSEWIFREDLLPILGRNRTLIFSDTDAFASHSVREYSLQKFISMGNLRIFPSIHLEETGISHLSVNSTAVFVNLAELEDEEVLKRISTAKNAPIPMQSLWDSDQAMFFDGGNVLVWNGSSLLVNGEQKFLEYVPKEYDKDHDYQRNVYYRFVANIRNQNYFLIGISLLIVTMFLVMGYYSRKQMHRRFLVPVKDASKGKENDDVSG
ncbi:MAG: DUF2334 domain-containing protein [Solobacterium sp.]|nr:DUF2334 domain-containing protein [Solobacterium sp.]